MRESQCSSGDGANALWRRARRLWLVVALCASQAASAAPPELATLETKAEAGDPVAMVVLGEVHWQGTGVPRSLATGLVWFRKAAELGNAEAHDALARAYGSGLGLPRNLDLALRHAREAVARGERQAARTRLVMILIERGDSPSEADLFGVRSAADEGYLPAAAVYGYCLLHGKGVPADVAKGLAWLERAAELNESEALRILGRTYAHGLPARGGQPEVTKEVPKAIALLERLANSDPAAAIDLARMYGSGVFGAVEGPKALEWFEKAANAGVVEGWIWMGTALLEGLVVPRDVPRALVALRHAVDAGHPDGQATLAAVFLDDSEPANDAEATALLEAAMAQGSGRAYDLRATAYARGHGGPRDPAKSLIHLERAVELGHFPARTRLAATLLRSSPSPETAQRAARLLESNVAIGDMAATIVLARLTFTARLGPPDPKRARELLETATAAGYAPAFVELGDLLLEPAFNDPASARALWARGAALGNSVAQCRLGAANGLATLTPPQRQQWLSACVASAPGDAESGAVAAVAIVHGAVGPPNREWARELFEQAVALGSLRAMVDYVPLLATPGPGQDVARARTLAREAMGMGSIEGKWLSARLVLVGDVSPDEAREPLQWLREAAEAGLREAQLDLGYVYAEGRHTSQDEAQALLWFQKASSAGLAEALRAEAFLLLRGKEPRAADAAERLKRAAEAGDASAAQVLAELLTKGAPGFPADVAAGFALFQKLAEAGMPDAMNALGHLHASGVGAPLSGPTALVWFTKAAEAGHRDAMTAAASLLVRAELGVPPDFIRGREWFRRAAQLGDPVAMEAYGVLLGDGEGGRRDVEEALSWLYLARSRMPPGELAARVAERIRVAELALPPTTVSGARTRAEALDPTLPR